MTSTRTSALTKPIVTRCSGSEALLDLSRPGDRGRRGGEVPTGGLLPLDTGFEELKLITLESELRIHVALRGTVDTCVRVFRLYAFRSRSDKQTVSLTDSFSEPCLPRPWRYRSGWKRYRRSGRHVDDRPAGPDR